MKLKRPSLPVGFLRLEGLAELVVALYFYKIFHGNWLTFALLFLVPDISIAAYAINKRVGAWAYNIAHTSALPFLLLVTSGLLQSATGILLSLIWLAHVGMDRVLGLGLKETKGFRYTHLGQIGKK